MPAPESPFKASWENVAGAVERAGDRGRAAQEGGGPVADSDGFGRSALTRRLPEPALEALAREVLSRMGPSVSAATIAARGSLAEFPAPAPRPPRSVPLPGRAAGSGRASGASEVEIAAFCETLLGADGREAQAFVEEKIADGDTFSGIYLDLLTPSAHRLGLYWEEDRAGFADVAVGIGRIYGILHHLRDLQPLQPPLVERHAIFATLPGEAHTLGATIAADVFRERGWEIDLLMGLDHEALVAAVDHSPARVLGISAASSDDLEPLLRLVVALHVRRPALRILVAGHLAAEQPSVAEITGVDMAAGDFETAYRGMCRLLDAAMHRPGRRA